MFGKYRMVVITFAILVITDENIEGGLNQFFVINNNKIYFGLTDIKGVGDSVYKKIIDISKTLDVDNLTWTEILFELLVKINSTAAKSR